MVTLMVNYEVVEKEYGKESGEFIYLLRGSNSKSKDTEIDKIAWLYAFSYFKNKSEFTPEYYENLFHMKFDERLEEEISKVRVNLSMSAGRFYMTDRVSSPVSDTIKEVVKFVTIQKMVNEQAHIGDQEVIDSIPIPKEEQIPESLEDQLKNAIDHEDYEEAARIRDQIKSQEVD